MNGLKLDIYKNALDLNETVVYEYDIINDVMNYTENVRKYIPCPTRIASYIDELAFRGKLHPQDLKKAITFFAEAKDDTVLKVEYLRILNYAGEYPVYQIKGRLILNDEGRPAMVYGTLTLKGEEEDREVLLGSRDPLTLLDNKETLIAKTENYYREMSTEHVKGLMVVDLYSLRIYRRYKGDSAADALLAEVAKKIRNALRGADIMGRYESNIFVVCMKGIHDERIYCERAAGILDIIKETTLSEWDDIEFSANIGIAIDKDGSKDGNIEGFAGMYEKAYKALLASREKKKGTYMLYSDRLHFSEEFKDIRISSREMELVKSILDPIETWAYAVNEKYELIYANKALSDRMDVACDGYCYARLKGYSEPCPECPVNNISGNSNTYDASVYSPSLRMMINQRATRIVLRNKTKLYIMAHVKEDVAHHPNDASDSYSRYADAVMRTNDVIWDVNFTKNKCIRIQERNILSFMEGMETDYRALCDNFLENLVHPEDREGFIALTDSEHIARTLDMGMNYIYKEVRLLTNDNGYKWHSAYTILQGSSDRIVADSVDVNPEGGIKPPKDACAIITFKNIDKLREDTIEKYTADARYKAMMKSSAFQMEIAQSNERYEHVNELTGIYVFEYDVTKGEYYICSTFDTLFDVSGGVLADEWSLLESFEVCDDDVEKYRQFVYRVKTEPDTHAITVRLKTLHSSYVWFTITVQTLKGLNNSLTRLTGVLQNVNAEMQVKAELEFRADYDSLTGLFNSEHFYRATRERIHFYPNKNYAILSVDIRRFKVLNDRFGVESGNACLKYLGNLIKKSLPWDGIAGHYQADVFSILLEYHDDQDIFEYMNALNAAFKYEDAIKCGSVLSYGIYKIVDRDIQVRFMCDRARFAKRDIKGNALVSYAVYDDKLRLVMREQSEIESEMRMALANHEFVMYLQPKYDAKTEKICGAEALVRWHHPIKGIRMPGNFLPLFEDNGFVRNLDEYMWEQAAKYLKRLTEYDVAIPISVNLSRIHIGNTNLVKHLVDLTEKYGIDRKLLELEITENYFMDDVRQLYDIMSELKNKGFILEMDDFGSGYSSLNMLRQAPVDVIKIDKFFLDEIMVTPRGKIVVENSIRMSKLLGLTVVAEGVETREQLEFIRDAGCDIVQGYYYSKPVTVEVFEEMLFKERGIRA